MSQASFPKLNRFALPGGVMRLRADAPGAAPCGGAGSAADVDAGSAFASWATGGSGACRGLTRMCRF
jgi:hypothetical protein